MYKLYTCLQLSLPPKKYISITFLQKRISTMNFSYFDTPKFLSTSLHFITCIEIPVHVFGVYMILCNTPDSMKSVKWSMFNLHVWSVFLDLSISLMTSPFALFPVLAGFPCGVLKEFGIPTPAQIFIVVVLFACKY